MMRILLVAAESAPYYKTGGVADVVFGLARGLKKQGHDARVIIPKYWTIKDTGQNPQSFSEPLIEDLPVTLGEYERTCDILKIPAPDHDTPDFYLLQQDYYFSRPQEYGYVDDYERFIFFSRGVLEMLKSPVFMEKEDGWFPHIFQGFDWATGLIPGWLPQYSSDPRFDRARFVYYVHNIRRMGVFGSRALHLAQQDKQGYFKQIGESNDQVNFLGRGLLLADKVVMVNPDFGPNNPLSENAAAIKPILEQRRAAGETVAIPSAIDEKLYNPASDPLLTRKFSTSNLPLRTENKLALQKQLNLPLDPRAPLLGIVSRVVPINGFELLKAIKEARSTFGKIQVAIMAEPGDWDLQNMLQAWEDEQHENVWIKSRFLFDDSLSKAIFGGCDLFLLLAQENQGTIYQYIAMRYGAIPLVYNTGSLIQSVVDYSPNLKLYTLIKEEGKGVGFKFNAHTEEAFLETVQRALSVYECQPDRWREIQTHNMNKQFKWDQPIADYLALYAQVMEEDRRPLVEGKSLTLNPEARLLQAALEIDSLPGLAKRDSRILLKQAARLVRHVVDCDAVYVWEIEKFSLEAVATDQLQNFQIVEQSLDPRRKKAGIQELSWDEVAPVLSRGSFNLWKQLGEVDLIGFCRSITGLEHSQVARSQGWVQGKSVVIAAHGRMMGRIDVLFNKPPSDENWINSALTVMASTFALRLDSIRLSNQIDQVSLKNTALLAARLSEDALQLIGKWVQEVTNADQVWHYTYTNELLPSEETEESLAVLPKADAALQKIEEVLRKTGQVPDEYLTHLFSDWTDAPRETTNSRRRRYRSLLIIPLVYHDPGGEIVKLGAVTAVRAQSASFTRSQEHFIQRHVVPAASAALYNHHCQAQRDKARVDQLHQLSESLISGGEIDLLLKNILDKTAQVLHVKAASLFIYDEEEKRLEIRAAYGFHDRYMQVEERDRPVYAIGQGVTGWLAEQERPFRAGSLQELQYCPRWRGDNNKKFDVEEPNCFLGMRLTVGDQLIGVIKFENRADSYPEKTFSDEDERLGEMMANVIATIVFNKQQNEKMLAKYNERLNLLSGVLAQSSDLDTLLQSIVDKLGEILGVNAASLFLTERDNEKNRILRLAAAYGYQAPLRDLRPLPTYSWGEGVTGTIAFTKEAIYTNTCLDLRKRAGGKGDGETRGKYDDSHTGQEQPESFYGLPLLVEGVEEPIGVLKVESLEQNFFIDEDLQLIKMIANVIATVVYNKQRGERELNKLSENLSKLSSVLVHSDLDTLLQGIIDKIGDVISMNSGSLYLTEQDERGKRILSLAAAFGYQRPLLEKKDEIYYEWGEGVTGTIAKEKRTVKTHTLQELRALAPGGQEGGKYDQDHDNKDVPQSFYGLPLVVEGEEESIGVLKVESLNPYNFTLEDERLIKMMANIIAVVVYNTRAIKDRLKSFSGNLTTLSDRLSSAHDMGKLLDQVVETIARLLHAEASSLYLIDPATHRLVIQAATGYQEVLVKRRATYEIGEGTTGQIAATGEKVVANSMKELQANSHKGKYDDDQGKRPKSFLGVPLKITDSLDRKVVIGVLKVEDIKKDRADEQAFTDQDIILVEMMASVIATVIQTSRWGGERAGDIFKMLGTFTLPTGTLEDLLQTFIQAKDESSMDQAARALAIVLDRYGSTLEQIIDEARALFKHRARKELFGRVSDWAETEPVKFVFGLFHAILITGPYEDDWEKVAETARPWLALRETRNRPAEFEKAALEIIELLSNKLRSRQTSPIQEEGKKLFGATIETGAIFGDPISSVPVLFQRQLEPNDELAARLNNIRQSSSTLLMVRWNLEYTNEQAKEAQVLLRKSGVDLMYASISDVLQVLSSADRFGSFRNCILPQVTTKHIFIEKGPVPETMFFGRQTEISKLREGARFKDFALVGNRRVGKTSLLRLVYNQMREDKSFIPIFIDCQEGALQTSQDFIARFQSICECDMAGRSLPEFSRAVDEIHKNTRASIVFLVDEVDKLLENDIQAGEPLMQTCRALSQKGACHFIFCGCSVLTQALHHQALSWFNFAEEVPLRPLPTEEAQDTLRKPLEMLGVWLEGKKESLARVADATSGHPNLIQITGNHLLRKAYERSSRQILVDDLDKWLASAEFNDNYLSILRGAASPFEMIICKLSPEGEFDRQLIIDRLEHEAGILLTPIEPQGQNIKLSPFSYLEGSIWFKRDGGGVQFWITERTLDDALRLLQIYDLFDQPSEGKFQVKPKDLLRRLRLSKDSASSITQLKIMLSRRK